MSYVRLPPLGLEFSLKASASTSGGVSASASAGAKTPAPTLVSGMDAATLAHAEKLCGKAPSPLSSSFPSWAKCVMTNGTGGSAPVPVATTGSGPCNVAAKNATIADVRRGCAVLKRGQSTGEGVRFWRQFLGLPAGTVFDVQLEDATKAFQSHMSLPNTGQLNKDTLAFALSQTLKEGSDNDDVWALHRLLGISPASTKFTKTTTQALVSYQRSMMLPVSGLVDDATRSALLAQGITPAMAAARDASAAAAAGKAAAAAMAAAAKRRPASDGGQPPSSASSSGSSSGSGSTGMLIMVGLVGLAAYFVWASPKVKRKSA